jgi:ribosome biogenesis GTPase / thiamine phosphate phosphatase
MKEGTVIKVAGTLYKVIDSESSVINCRIKGKLRIKDLKSTNPVTVGDKVLYDLLKNNEGVIIEIMDRKNYIIRKSTNWSKQYHIIAANVDQAFLIATLKEPETNTDFIDRYLVTAKAFSIPVVIVFNKYDLYDNGFKSRLSKLMKLYIDIGYFCIETSALTGKNMIKLAELLKDKITVLNSNSGVGKSMLIKSIDPDINLKINEISHYHKTGIHTTTYSEMYKIKTGGYLIDTPGIKGFGLIDFYKEELYHYFPEFFEISNKCKFYNCTHIHEPDCAVIQAVEIGKIAQSRYESYFNLFHDDNKKYRI